MIGNKLLKFAVLGLALISVSMAWSVSRAQLTIDITRGVSRPLPIVVVPFGKTSPIPHDVAAIVAADLRRSSRFQPLPPEAYTDRPTNFSEINFETWRNLRMDHVVVGRVGSAGTGQYVVKFQLAEVFSGNQLLDLSFKVSGNELRRLAHQISDLVYEKITGANGFFSTRIAYVSVNPRAASPFSLVVSDIDGYNPKLVLRSKRPVMSPAWAPDGDRLAYVTFENRRAQIVVQDVYRGSRRIVSTEPGINGAPAWSPDGGRLAITLSRDGDPEIYIFELRNSMLTRVTNNSAIDTEPTWSSDGRSLVFTSDRGGSPQLYRKSLGSGRAERITFEGDYNAAPRFSPDGRYLAMVHRGEEGSFRVAVMNMSNGRIRVLSNGAEDESPSFAPNSRLIVYASNQGGRGSLAAVSVDGKERYRLASQGDNVRDPDWSPYLR